MSMWYLSRVVVPQLLVQSVWMSLLPLDFSDDVKHLRVRAAGTRAALSVRVAVRVTAAGVWEKPKRGFQKLHLSTQTDTDST